MLPRSTPYTVADIATLTRKPQDVGTIKAFLKSTPKGDDTGNDPRKPSSEGHEGQASESTLKAKRSKWLQGDIHAASAKLIDEATRTNQPRCTTAAVDMLKSDTRRRTPQRKSHTRNAVTERAIALLTRSIARSQGIAVIAKHQKPPPENEDTPRSIQRRWPRMSIQKDPVAVRSVARRAHTRDQRAGSFVPLASADSCP